MTVKTILHLCADLGSDSIFYQKDPAYEVIKVGQDIGVENYTVDKIIHGIIANPVCTEFSTARGRHKMNKSPSRYDMVKHVLRIIEEAKQKGGLKFHAIENPATGEMGEYLGRPRFVYQPYEFGSPWTKKTALWGEFIEPTKTHTWDTCTKIRGLYIRPGRDKPSLAFMHKSAIHLIPEFKQYAQNVKTDADFRSLCCVGFAKAFYESNK